MDASLTKAIRASYTMAKGFLKNARRFQKAGDATTATAMVRMANACRQNIASYRSRG